MRAPDPALRVGDGQHGRGRDAAAPSSTRAPRRPSRTPAVCGQDLLCAPPSAREADRARSPGARCSRVLPFGNAHGHRDPDRGADDRRRSSTGSRPSATRTSPAAPAGSRRSPGSRSSSTATGRPRSSTAIWKTPDGPAGPADAGRRRATPSGSSPTTSCTPVATATPSSPRAPNVKFTGNAPARRGRRVHHRAPAGQPGRRGPDRRPADDHRRSDTDRRDGHRARPFGVFAVASRRDPRTRIRARQAARQARRLPHEGRPRRRRLCRQGAEPAQPRPLVLAEAGARRRDPPDPERHRPGRRRRGDPDRLRLRGAPPRGEPHQALPAALQRPAQGRQELPVHQGDPRRRLPAGRADAQARQRRQPLLRAVRVGVERRRVDEPRPPALPVPDLHDRHQGRRARAPAAVPPVSHQALPGPVHHGHLEGRLPGRHRPGRAVPRGPPGDPGQGARDARWRRPPSGPTTSGRPSCATRSGRSSGRWRARRWPPSPGPSSTCSASPARTTRRPSSCS